MRAAVLLVALTAACGQARPPAATTASEAPAPAPSPETAPSSAMPPPTPRKAGCLDSRARPLLAKKVKVSGTSQDFAPLDHHAYVMRLEVTSLAPSK